MTWDDYCILTPQGEVCQLECREFNDRDLNLSIAFEGMWFDFPTPFHAGDILCSHRWPDEPFVLTDLCTWDAETYRREMPVSECSDKWLSNLDRTLARMRAKGDVSDMTAVDTPCRAIRERPYRLCFTIILSTIIWIWNTTEGR